MLQNVIHAILARMLATSETEISALSPELLTSLKAANVKFGDLLKNLVSEGLTTLSKDEPSVAAEVEVLTPFITQYVSAQEPQLIAALGGEETALVSAAVARAQQLLAKI